ncbi:hypothetical protein [Streptomyces bluensis]|uniref:hypothetical protein n=1 Tax=Streptomyces bluensis TaxID=33897 RepID=UPI00332AD8AE
MSQQSEFVERVVRLAEVHAEAHWELDWSRVEASLGHALPFDYKRLCEELPPGKFCDFFWILHPVGSKGASMLGRSSELIEAVEEFIEDEDECPGESGRIFPCFVTDNGDVGYWIADTDNPDDWTVAINEGRGPEWEPTELSLSAFLYQLLTGGYVSGLFPESLRSREPRFSSNF